MNKRAKRIGIAKQYNGLIDYNEDRGVDQEIENQFEVLHEVKDDIRDSDVTSLEETAYLNSIPNLVESIKAAQDEPLDSMEIYDPDEEW